jgi:hypothetical protein
MRKSFFLAAAITVASASLNAQVGINTETPKATLDVVASKTDGTTVEGFIPPRLTLAQINAKQARFGADQKGAIVYVTDVSGARNAGYSDKVTAAGHYFFDGTQWEEIITETGKWFYMPSIPIDVTQPSIGNGAGINLYSLYVAQMNNGIGLARSPGAAGHNLDKVYTVDEIDFFILGYDTGVFDNVQVSNAGVLTGDIDNEAVTSATYMNIAFKVK